jgi:hypothetical protein
LNNIEEAKYFSRKVLKEVLPLTPSNNININGHNTIWNIISKFIHKMFKNDDLVESSNVT